MLRRMYPTKTDLSSFVQVYENYRRSFRIIEMLRMAHVMVSASVFLQNNSLVYGSLGLSVGLPVVNFQMRKWSALPSRYVV